MPGGGSSVHKKWLPDEDADSAKFYSECKSLYKSAKVLVSKLKNTLMKYKQGIGVDQEFDANIESMAQVVDSMKRVAIYQTLDPSREIESHKKNLWKCRLWIERLAISRLANDLIVQFLDSPLVESVLRLAYLYNECLQLNLSGDSRGVNVFCNTCPMLLYPLRKLSITKILAVLANKRAECCSYMLVDGLLSNYLSPNKTNIEQEEPITVDNVETAEIKDETISGTLQQGPGSEIAQTDKTEDEKITQALLDHPDSVCSDTSVEIYRALTKHLMQKEDEQSESLKMMLKLEEKRVASLLAVTARVAPQLLPTNCCKPSKTAGQPRVKKQVKRKLTDYYQEVLWSEVGGYLEHGLLWWSADPLGSFPPAHSQHLRDHVVGLKRTEFIPQLLVPSTISLLDALCCHVTSTSWDQLFRKTLVAAGNLKGHVYGSYGIEGTATGQLFVEMLSDLIQLNNSCEDLYLSLEDIPLVEQIPILHRLDHSVHTVRLWATSQCRQLASSWNVDEFYCTCHTDISKCLEVLSKVQLADHGEIPSTTSVQVTVCAKMRAKLVSEVRANIEKLKKTPLECISVLASACRTECLANLHMYFPPPLYWRQNGPLPDCASDYVENYLDCILRPVLLATNKMELTIQQSSSAMVLRILCESWLEYIYLHRVKFSEWGAVQLLTDFGAVPTWLMERVKLKKELLNQLVAHEVLKRCEGVGRLLLRRRGESIAMSQPTGHRSSGEDTSADNNMPAEMYVPNQEQWLELRAPMRANMCCQL